MLSQRFGMMAAAMRLEDETAVLRHQPEIMHAPGQLTRSLLQQLVGFVALSGGHTQGAMSPSTPPEEYSNPGWHLDLE